MLDCTADALDLRIEGPQILRRVSGTLLGDGAVLKVDAVVRLVNRALEAALGEHRGGDAFGLLGLNVEQQAKLVEVNVRVQL